MLIPNTGFVGALKGFVSKHSNFIFGALGVLGVAGTAICSSIAATHASEVLREYEDQDLTAKEKFKLVWPEYIWTAIVGLGTCSSIVISNVVSAKKAAALTAALLITKEQLDTTRDVFNDYRQETMKYLPQDPEERAKIQKIIDGRHDVALGNRAIMMLQSRGANHLHPRTLFGTGTDEQ